MVLQYLALHERIAARDGGWQQACEYPPHISQTGIEPRDGLVQLGQDFQDFGFRCDSLGRIRGARQVPGAHQQSSTLRYYKQDRRTGLRRRHRQRSLCRQGKVEQHVESQRRPEYPFRIPAPAAGEVPKLRTRTVDHCTGRN